VVGAHLARGAIRWCVATGGRVWARRVERRVGRWCRIFVAAGVRWDGGVGARVDCCVRVARASVTRRRVGGLAAIGLAVLGRVVAAACAEQRDDPNEREHSHYSASNHGTLPVVRGNTAPRESIPRSIRKDNA
jgi:hypothetical protein